MHNHVAIAALARALSDVSEAVDFDSDDDWGVAWRQSRVELWEAFLENEIPKLKAAGYSECCLRAFLKAAKFEDFAIDSNLK